MQRLFKLTPVTSFLLQHIFRLNTYSECSDANIHTKNCTYNPSLHSSISLSSLPLETSFIAQWAFLHQTQVYCLSWACI